MTVAITSSTLPGNPVGRMLRHRVRGFPAPHVAVMAERRFDPRRTVVFDARDVEGPLVVYDVRVGASITTALLANDGPAAFVPIWNALRANLLSCRVNGVVVGPDALLDARADVVDFSHQPDPLSSSVSYVRPPTPPIPEQLSDFEAGDDVPLLVAASSAPRWRRSRAEQSAQAAEVAAVRLARANPVDEDLPICTIFDPVRQYELAETSDCRSSSRLLDFALSKARHLGLDPEGRVLNHPLPGLPRPQVCIHSVVHANYVVLPVDLGSGHFCTLAMERSASAIELSLHLEAVCGAPRAHRSLLAKGWLTLAVNGLPVEDPFPKDALILADSARLLKAPEADPGLAADRLRPERARPSPGKAVLPFTARRLPPFMCTSRPTRRQRMCILLCRYKAFAVLRGWLCPLISPLSRLIICARVSPGMCLTFVGCYLLGSATAALFILASSRGSPSARVS